MHSSLVAVENATTPILDDMMRAHNEEIPFGAPLEAKRALIETRVADVVHDLVRWVRTAQPNIGPSNDTIAVLLEIAKLKVIESADAVRDVRELLIKSWSPSGKSLRDALSVACVLDALDRIIAVVEAETTEDHLGGYSTAPMWMLAEGAHDGRAVDESAARLLFDGYREVVGVTQTPSLRGFIRAIERAESTTPPTIFASWAAHVGVLEEFWSEILKLREQRLFELAPVYRELGVSVL